MNWYMMKHPPPRGMPKKETAALLSVLRDMRRAAMMRDANFFAFDESADEKMEEIRLLTERWRRG